MKDIRTSIGVYHQRFMAINLNWWFA